MKVKIQSKLGKIFPSRGGHPGIGNPIGLSRKSLFDLVGVGEGTPVRHGHDFSWTELIPIRSDQQAALERPACPVLVNDPHITRRKKLNKLSRGIRRIFTTFPSSSCRDVDLTPVRNLLSLDTIKSRMLVYGAKCSHGKIIHIVSTCLRNLLSEFYAYNVYYFNDLAQQTSSFFKDFLQSSRTISPGAFCYRVFLCLEK